MICNIATNNIPGAYRRYAKAYSVWVNMFLRVHGKYRRKSYDNVLIHEDWHNFESFLLWYLTTKNAGIKGFQLEKDLLSPSGQKIYSPETCCFLPQNINSRLTTKNPEKLAAAHADAHKIIDNKPLYYTILDNGDIATTVKPQ